MGSGQAERPVQTPVEVVATVGREPASPGEKPAYTDCSRIQSYREKTRGGGGVRKEGRREKGKEERE